jgi:hypothetical protein
MCIIIVKPAGKGFASDIIANAERANPDGWGLAFLEGEHIAVLRGFGAKSLARAVDECGKRAAVLHCRIATSGTITLDNTHPFAIAGAKVATLVFHNGVFSDIALTEQGKSDTWHVARRIAPMFAREADPLANVFARRELETYCKEQRSKLVFFSRTSLHVLNESAGVWKNGVWFSNHSAFPKIVAQRTRYDWSELSGDTSPFARIAKGMAQTGMTYTETLDFARSFVAQKMQGLAPNEIFSIAYSLVAGKRFPSDPISEDGFAELSRLYHSALREIARIEKQYSLLPPRGGKRGGKKRGTEKRGTKPATQTILRKRAAVEHTKAQFEGLPCCSAHWSI